MSNKEKRYGLIQIPIEVHEELKKYCDKYGFKIGHLTANIIKKYIKSNEKD